MRPTLGRMVTATRSTALLVRSSIVPAPIGVDASILDRLLQSAGATGSVALGNCGGTGAGNGLYATAAADKGGTLLQVPRSINLCIEGGNLTVPEGRWPRLAAGARREGEPLPWDLLLALALLDGLAGDGHPFWQDYAGQLLPAPEDLTLPLCWEAPLLAELQHEAIAQAALEQQDRLRALLPGMATPIGAGEPSWLQWAFACVRSRAFRLGPDAFAFVPFLDLANHAPSPRADFTAAPAGGVAGPGDGAAAASQDGWVRLLALSPLQAGQEATVSYSGPQGYTSQRFQAQYGFVPREGNLADRLDMSAALAAGGGGAAASGGTLRLAVVQEALGDAALMDAAKGKLPALFAALKSLPFADKDGDGEAAGAPGSAKPTAAEARTAEALLGACDVLEGEWMTSLAADEQLLSQLEAAGAAAGGAAGSAAPAAHDVRLEAAVRYRVGRKRLVAEVRRVLRVFAG